MSKGNKILPKASGFYKEILLLLTKNEIPFLVGGGYALMQYTGIYRDTKDLDIYCKPGEYTRLLECLNANGYATQLTDARWLAKVFKNDHLVDIIFSSVNNLTPVTDSWFRNGIKGKLFDIPVLLVAPEELIWCKLYVQNRNRYDGADINHLILKREINWERLLEQMEQHWMLLLAQMLNFLFIYPAEKDRLPGRLFTDLLKRAEEQYNLPPSVGKICRGPLLENTAYTVDIVEWGYKTSTVEDL